MKKDYIAFVRGTEDERKKIRVLAEAKGASASQFILDMLNTEYERLYGQAPPELFLSDTPDHT